MNAKTGFALLGYPNSCSTIRFQYIHNSQQVWFGKFAPTKPRYQLPKGGTSFFRWKVRMIPIVPSKESWYHNPMILCVCENVGSLFGVICHTKDIVNAYDLAFRVRGVVVSNLHFLTFDFFDTECVTQGPVV